MKVIEMLDRISNGERPKKIKYDNKIYNWSITTGNYILEDDRNVAINWDFVSMFDLRNEVEIIGEDKKIEKLVGIDKGVYIDYNMCDIVGKINEIIDKINEEN